MEKHILIPTDFSPNAKNALNYAISLYKDQTVTFYLLNAFQLFHFTTDSVIEPQPGEKDYEDAKRNSEERLKDLLSEVSSRPDGKTYQFKTISRYENVLNAVKETVENFNIDLIIMGTKGENNPINILYGSNAINMMEKVDHCAVMVIPENTIFKENSFKEVVFSTNYKSSYKRRELKPFMDILRRFDAPVRVLYVEDQEKFSEEQETNKEILKEILRNFKHSFHTLTHIKVASGIHAFIESRDSSLLVLYYRKHGFLSHLFSKSLLKELGFSPQVPVLVLKEI